MINLRLVAPSSRSANDTSQPPARAFVDQPDFWAAFAHAATGMMIADLSGHFVYANPAYCSMIGYSEKELQARSVRELTHPDDRSDTLKMARRLLDGEFPGYVAERRYLHADGRQIWVRNSMSVVRDATGQAVAMLAIAEDVTAGKQAEAERTQAEEALRASEERLRIALEATGLGTWDWDATTGRTIWSDGMQTLYGLKAGSYNEKLDMFSGLVHPEDAERVAGLVRGALATHTDYELEYRSAQPRPDGSPRWLFSRAHLAFDNEGTVLRAIGTVLDITERKLAEQELQHRAFHDTLTGLPNRALFTDRLEHALARADRQRNSVAVLFVDLDNFKLVNDQLGHAQGDALLKTMAERLHACLRNADTGARLGGDEFTVLLEDVASEAHAIAVANRISDALSVPVVLQDREIVVSASIGLAIGPSGERQDLLREADLAMYRAKSNGKARCEMFDPGLENRAMQRVALRFDLRRALARSEFQVHYQPIISVEDETICGVEALVRWDHPEHGLVLPLHFIPVAEETGFIIPIGQWVLEQACQQARKWQDQFPRARPLTVSVNVSARQLQHPDLVADVTRAVEQAGLSPGCLELEITESAMMKDAEASIATLQAFKAIGIRLAIDDFGTGYSSLSYLKRFPVDTLKIDRSFVDGLGRDSQDTAIVRSVAALARALDMNVTGEGVESRAQHTLVQQLGCDRAQGYLYARPVPAAEMTALLARDSTWSQSQLAA